MTTKRMSEERLEEIRSVEQYHSFMEFGELLAEIDTLRTELTVAERNWAEQEERGTIAQTDLNIALNKLAAAERERDEARAALAEAREALERIANHPNANALILTGKPMIGVGTLARDVLATPTQESETP